ncbi:MAG: hypothetical protein M1368_05735, partial [Thaumarchaeota archaeon]|nr:hypothetical protein [Nitrososphaerota archaeon]
MGNGQIYSGRLSAGSLTHETQITSDSESKVGARFSPDSEYLMYASDYHGDEKFDLFLTDLHDITKKRNLTENTNYSILPNASFSHDGEKLVYVANPEGQFSVYVQSLADGSTKRISNHAYSDYHGVFSPDDSKVAFASTVSGQDSGLFVAPSDGGETKQLLDPKTRQSIDASDPEWSPDGKTIAFMSSSRGSYDIGLLEIEEDKVAWLTDSKNECYESAFSHDGKTVAYTLNAEGNIKLVLHDLREGSRAIEFHPGVIGRPKFTHDDQSVVFLFTSPKNPPDLFEYSTTRRQFTQLTNSLPERNLSKLGLSIPELRVLKLLHNSTPVTMAGLSKELMLTQAAM